MRSGRLYLVDTSAFARVAQAPVGQVLAGLVAEQVAATTCVTVELEAGYSGRSDEDVRAIAERRRDGFRVLPMNEGIAQRARDVQVRMASCGHHRVAGVIDLLTAAIAEHHGAVILHYEADFEHIAATTASPTSGSYPGAGCPELFRASVQAPIDLTVRGTTAGWWLSMRFGA